MCFYKDLPFPKTLKSSLPFHTPHLTFHFLINTFIISVIQNFFPYTYLPFISNNTYIFCPHSDLSSEICFHASAWILTCPTCFCLAALTRPGSFPCTLPYLFLCSLLSNPHPPPHSGTRTFIYSFSLFVTPFPCNALPHTVLCTCT